MSNPYISTGILRSAEQITGITGAQTFSGTDTNGFFFYDERLNPLAGLTVQLFPYLTGTNFDYIVSPSGKPIRSAWLSSGPNTTVYWDQVTIDTKVSVSNDNTSWTTAYFAKYDTSDPAGNYFYVWGNGATSSTASSTSNEVTEITMVSASTLNSKYFLLWNGLQGYYVWFDVGSNGTDPGTQGQSLYGKGYTAIPVSLASTDTAAQVATKTQVAIAAFSSAFYSMIKPGTTDVVSVATVATGETYDAEPASSGVSIVVKIQGGDMVAYKYAKLVL